MKYKDYYAILGVAHDASREEINKAYRRLARKYHPDVSREAGAEERIKEINEARDILGDPDKRVAYDRLGHHQSGQDFRPPPGWAGGSGRGTDFSGMDFSDLFSQLFGAGRAGASHSRGRPPTPGRDVEMGLELTLEEAFHGVEKRIDTHANGSVRLRIPPGTLPDKRLRLAGKGAPSSDGGAPGDLLLRIRLSPHPVYRLEGADIHLDTPITPWEAVLGATLLVPTPGGNVRVRVPAGARSGQKLRLAGRGMPVADNAGDFHVELRVVVPAESSEAERALYEQLGVISGFDPRPGFPRE